MSTKDIVSAIAFAGIMATFIVIAGVVCLLSYPIRFWLSDGKAKVFTPHE